MSGIVLIAVFQSLGKNELFLHFLPNPNYPLPNSPVGEGVGGVMTKRVEREILGLTHHVGPLRSRHRLQGEARCSAESPLKKVPIWVSSAFLLSEYILSKSLQTLILTCLIFFFLSFLPLFLVFCNSALGTFKSSFTTAGWKQLARLPRRPFPCWPFEDKACVLS